MKTNTVVSCFLAIVLGTASIAIQAQAQKFNEQSNPKNQDKSNAAPNRPRVTSSGGSVRVNGARLAPDCSVSSQTGNWIALFPRRPRPQGLAEGCTYTFASGEFSGPPACTCTVNAIPGVPASEALVDQWCVVDGAVSETWLNVRVTRGGGAATAVPAEAHLICVGPH